MIKKQTNRQMNERLVVLQCQKLLLTRYLALSMHLICLQS